MVESRVEARFVKLVEKHGGKTVKIFNKKDWPDRIILFRWDKWAFVELKKPGEKPRPGQVRVHTMLANMGFTINVVDGSDWEATEAWIKEFYAQP